MQITPINNNKQNFTMALKYQGNRTYIRNELNKLPKENLLHLKEIKKEFKDYKYVDIVGKMIEDTDTHYQYLKYFLGIKRGKNHELFDYFSIKSYLLPNEEGYFYGIDGIANAARLMEKHIEEVTPITDEILGKSNAVSKK